MHLTTLIAIMFAAVTVAAPVAAPVADPEPVAEPHSGHSLYLGVIDPEACCL